MDITFDNQSQTLGCIKYFHDIRKARLSNRSLQEKTKQIKKLSEKLSFSGEKDLYQAVANGSLKATVELENLMLRPKSDLFSGTGMFRTLSEVILPDLISRNANDKLIKFWVPGCGAGREVYSLALFLHAQKEKLTDWSLSVTGSDTSTIGLDEAKRARIPYEDIDQVVNELYGAGLKHQDDEFLIINKVRHITNFVHGNFTDDAIENAPFDAIFFRGHLEFWQPSQQQQIIENLDKNLKPGGYLVLSSKESLLGLIGNYRPANSVPGFYRKTSD